MAPRSRISVPNYAAWAHEAIESLCSVVSRGSAPVYVEHSGVRAIGQRCVAVNGFDPSAARPHLETATRGTLSPEAGDVLLNSTGTGTIGRSAVFCAPGRFIVDGHVTLLRPRPSRAEGRWLNAVLRTWWGQNYLETQCYSGSTNQVELSRTRLAAAELPTPPVPEQRRIAEILNTLDEAIRKTEQLIGKLKQVKQGLLHDLLTRGIDDNGELRDPARHPEQFKESDLGRIPAAWTVARLGSSLLGIDAGKSPNCPDRPATGDEWGVLKVSAVRHDGFQARENKVVTNLAFLNKAFEVRDGDLLITRANTPELVGLTCLVRRPRPRLLLCDKTLRLRVGGEDDRRYIFFVTQMPYVRRQIEINATGSSGSMKNIGQAAILALRILRPPRGEQTAIADALGAIEECLANEIDGAKKLQQLKRGLMEDLLTGRVRVADLLNEAAA